ncbi:uncharacterized protein PADG_00904 [Paracoccidioides brasiliensis Pb18]|uniref:Uncharacterized protein n=2 Tax=Paracoccidioides brasiliensis TaxID=121759 RepID=C1FYM8_PARBD|nr:uncharacterized protein PADG_00904 [Paracoccidioides brasiliensis Pb18]EEH44615.2 hypothetical protein PADG_00904 [Paracoccidioides brasiliensis Pb18]ODH28499.1 hypothetical protein ACO22_03928 [Paracoccidioides brasiliensis]ODH49417.1 hypothetical protein GX48_04502 [Paracoccidioides brasiliensis]
MGAEVYAHAVRSSWLHSSGVELKDRGNHIRRIALFLAWGVHDGMRRGATESGVLGVEYKGRPSLAHERQI